MTHSPTVLTNVCVVSWCAASFPALRYFLRTCLTLGRIEGKLSWSEGLIPWAAFVATPACPPSQGMGFHKLSDFVICLSLAFCSVPLIFFSSYYVWFQRRQSELYVKQFTLIVFTQVNSIPTILFYNLVVPLFIGSCSWLFYSRQYYFLFIDWLSINKEPPMPPWYLTKKKKNSQYE